MPCLLAAPLQCSLLVCVSGLEAVAKTALFSSLCVCVSLRPGRANKTNPAEPSLTLQRLHSTLLHSSSSLVAAAANKPSVASPGKQQRLLLFSSKIFPLISKPKRAPRGSKRTQLLEGTAHSTKGEEDKTQTPPRFRAFPRTSHSREKGPQEPAPKAASSTRPCRDTFAFTPFLPAHPSPGWRARGTKQESHASRLTPIHPFFLSLPDPDRQTDSQTDSRSRELAGGVEPAKVVENSRPLQLLGQNFPGPPSFFFPLPAAGLTPSSPAGSGSSSRRRLIVEEEVEEEKKKKKEKAPRRPAGRERASLRLREPSPRAGRPAASCRRHRCPRPGDSLATCATCPACPGP